MMKHEAQKCGPIETNSVDALYEIPAPPATQQPAAVSCGGGTEREEDVVYEVIPGDQ